MPDQNEALAAWLASLNLSPTVRKAVGASYARVVTPDPNFSTPTDPRKCRR